jgi:hypothetical protein
VKAFIIKVIMLGEKKFQTSSNITALERNWCIEKGFKPNSGT